MQNFFKASLDRFNLRIIIYFNSMKSQTNLHLNWTNNTKIETNIIKPKNLDSLKNN